MEDGEVQASEKHVECPYCREYVNLERTVLSFPEMEQGQGILLWLCPKCGETVEEDREWSIGRDN